MDSYFNRITADQLGMTESDTLVRFGKFDDLTEEFIECEPNDTGACRVLIKTSKLAGAQPNRDGAANAQILLIGMNPSDAEDFFEETDPTVKKLRTWINAGVFDELDQWNGHITLVNLTAICSRKSKEVRSLIRKYGGEAKHLELSLRCWKLALESAEKSYVIAFWGHATENGNTDWKRNFISRLEALLYSDPQYHQKVIDILRFQPKYPLHPQVIAGTPEIVRASQDQ